MLFKHSVRNALIPIVTIIALDFGALIGGLIITENIFNYPGMGVYFVDAGDDRRLPEAAAVPRDRHDLP